MAGKRKNTELLAAKRGSRSARDAIGNARKNYLRSPTWGAEVNLVKAHEALKKAEYRLGFATAAFGKGGL